jgi:hypothetical protein
MKELIQILEIAATKHGPQTPLTIGHLANLCKMAERAKRQSRERKADLEEEGHKRIMEEISWGGQA